MEVGMEVVEDDLFFADLSKQISLLIMDDDEVPVARCHSVSLQAFSRAIYPNTQSTGLYEQTFRRETKGTGVFIPRSTHTRRKNKQGRFSSSSNTKFHKQQRFDNSKGLHDDLHIPYNNINNKSYYSNSFNPQKSAKINTVIVPS